jgi:hypothetical protein
VIKEVTHNSSMIKGSRYDEVSRSLVITFNNDSEYSYSDIDPETYEKFISEESTGRAFNQHVKSRAGTKIEK